MSMFSLFLGLLLFNASSAAPTANPDKNQENQNKSENNENEQLPTNDDHPQDSTTCEITRNSSLCNKQCEDYTSQKFKEFCCTCTTASSLADECAPTVVLWDEFPGLDLASVAEGIKAGSLDGKCCSFLKNKTLHNAIGCTQGSINSNTNTDGVTLAPAPEDGDDVDGEDASNTDDGDGLAPDPEDGDDVDGEDTSNTNDGDATDTDGVTFAPAPEDGDDVDGEDTSNTNDGDGLAPDPEGGDDVDGEDGSNPDDPGDDVNESYADNALDFENITAGSGDDIQTVTTTTVTIVSTSTVQDQYVSTVGNIQTEGQHSAKASVSPGDQASTEATDDGNNQHIPTLDDDQQSIQSPTDTEGNGGDTESTVDSEATPDAPESTRVATIKTVTSTEAEDISATVVGPQHVDTTSTAAVTVTSTTCDKIAVKETTELAKMLKAKDVSYTLFKIRCKKCKIPDTGHFSTYCVEKSTYYPIGEDTVTLVKNTDDVSSESGGIAGYAFVALIVAVAGMTIYAYSDKFKEMVSGSKLQRPQAYTRVPSNS